MANTPKKIKDPTEAALSAIQDALSARDAAEAEAASPLPAQAVPLEESTSEPSWRAVPSATPDEEPRQPEEQSLLRRAANDDRESIGQILRTLQRRPAHTSYVTATVFAGLWVLAGLVLGWMYLPELQSALGPTGLTAPVLAMLGVVFFVPIMFFYVLAHMAWRSQEMTELVIDTGNRLADTIASRVEEVNTTLKNTDD